MRNLLLLTALFLSACGNTTCENKIPDGYYVKYSTIRNTYTICHVKCTTQYDYHINHGDDYIHIVKDTTIECDTSWIGKYVYFCGCTFNTDHYNWSLATFSDSCDAKKACLEALNSDDVTTDFK